MDALLLYMSCLLCRTVVTARSQRGSRLVADLLPFATWQVFSLVLCDFLFPNTVCAKLNNGIGPRELKREGAAKQAAYYDKLRLITYGPMIAADRWTAIWKMHRGAYNV